MFRIINKVSIILLAFTFFVLSSFLVMGSEQSEAFPTKPIRLIVHTPAGGGADTNIRHLQPFLEAELGVPVMLDNRPGAASMIGPKLVSESEPDGYTIGMGGSPHNEVGLLTMEGMFEPEDICILGSLTLDAAVIQVRKDSPWNTFEEFIEDAKKRPGEITASVGTATGDNYLGFRLIEEATGIDLNIVSFGGGSPARLALAGGHVDVNHASLFSSRHIAEDVRVLAVHWDTNNWREMTDNAPTIVELIPDIKKVKCGTIDFMLAPGGLKEKYPERYEFLAKAIGNAINNPEFQKKLEELGATKQWNYMDQDEMTEYFYGNIESYREYLPYFEEEIEERS
jgi:tripartite-type tricarboxylate transporter receptor subunit TctC